ncbi:MAG TPA: tetratricopeptide repeat protein [Candidatus Baltobacteraceae bacterium]|jgi:tetratricopeptide (TPR) repeat protein
MRLKGTLVITAGAIIALAVWPTIVAHRAQAPAASFTPAPVDRDYLQRDKYVAFEEKIVRHDPQDQITARMLASQYLQRFREQGDIGDIARAQSQAERSIKLQPQGNTAAQMSLASALLTYHQFGAALKHEQDAIDGEPFNQNAVAQKASLLMELGRYPAAQRILAHPSPGPENPTWDSVLARYDELTGKMPEARRLIDRASRRLDSDYYAPAYDRSWYHMRAGQLAFEAGDNATAETEFAQSLRLFPDNYMALLWQARYYRARKEWQKSLDSATRSADIYPLPQVLGYKADAQRALGDASGAAKTDALIRAEQRLFNVQGINDRLLANYYAQRHIYMKDALQAAREDYVKRGDEIYADDTMGWVLATMGRWNEARVYTERAVRYNTQDADVQYHAAIVALHTGHRDEAKRRLSDALSINPQFDPFDADDARTQLAKLAPSP